MIQLSTDLHSSQDSRRRPRQEASPEGERGSEEGGRGKTVPGYCKEGSMEDGEDRAERSTEGRGKGVGGVGSEGVGEPGSERGGEEASETGGELGGEGNEERGGEGGGERDIEEDVVVPVPAPAFLGLSWLAASALKKSIQSITRQM